MDEVEKTLKVNVGSVNDLRDALKDVPWDRRIEIQVFDMSAAHSMRKAVIEEIAIHEDGHVVLHVR